MNQSTSFAQVATNLLNVLQGYTKGIRFLLVMFLTLTVSANVWGADFEKYSGTITEGDYLIVYSNGAMKNTVSSDRLQYSDVTVSNNKISNPDASLIWHIAPNGSYWTIYNANVSKYAAGTRVKNKAQLLASGTDDRSLWTVSGTSSTYEFVNKANKAAGVNSNLRRNGTYGFACYATGTGGALTLYKKVTSTSSYTVTATSNNNTCGTVSVSGTTITASPNIGYTYANPAYTVTSGDATVTQNGDIFTVTPSSDCSIQINFEAIPTHKVYFNTGGLNEITPVSVAEGSTYNINQRPTGLTDECEYNTFAGWTISSTTLNNANECPEIVTSITMSTSDITLYAVYQRTEEGEGGGSTPTEVSKTYTFSDYDVGTQYAAETYELDDDVTIKITGCYINTQLRVYGGQPGIVISEVLPGRIVSMGFNMGYKADKLVVSGSTDGTSWNKVGSISTTTSYKDYTLDFWETNYTYFKLNVEGSSQIRIAKMSITYESTSGGGSSSTTYYHSTPECTTETSYSVTSTLSHVTAAGGNPTTITSEDKDLTLFYSPVNGWNLPATISVTMGGTPLSSETDYMWDQESGELLIGIEDDFAFTGNIEVTINGWQQLAAPTGLNVPNTTSSGATLAWNAVTHATSYTVQVYGENDEIIAEYTDLTQTTKEVSGLESDTYYIWAVTAIGDGTTYTDSEESETAEFTTQKACEQLGAATDLTVETDYVHTDGKTYVKFSWTPANNTKNNAASQKLCFGKVGEAGKCVDDLLKNITWTGDEVSKLEPGTYWWSIQALGDGVKYCDGDVVNGTKFTIIAYNIIIDSNIQYGKVTTDLTQAVVDKTVTLTATPEKGYQFSSWIVTKEGGGTITVTNNQFTMPASDVTVSAIFTQLPKLTTPTNLSVSDISCSNATLAWSAVAGASKYELRLTNTSTSNTTTSYPTTNSADLTLVAGTTYSWTVQAIGDGITYNNSDITEGEDFTSHYTITYDENGGSTVGDDCGTTLPSELPTTAKSHYTFIGWYMDEEFNTPATTGAKLTQNTTLYAKWEEIKFTITWSINGNTTNSQELQEGTTITPPADPEAATYACEDKVFIGWVGTPIDGSINEEPTFITDFGNVEEDKTYYAVFATPSGDGFTLGQSGDFTIYANVGGTNYYATGDIGDNSKNGKISSTTTESDANRYTFTAISASNEAFTYTIKKGTTYIAYSKNAQNNSTDFKNQDDSYTWTISKGTKGSWRVASETVGRAFVFRAGSGYNLFGGYATQNITDNQTIYYDIEIGGATTYTEYVTSCVTCENVLTIIKGKEENGTFTLDKVGEQETCEGLSIIVTLDPAEHYHVASVSASTGEIGVDNGDGTYTITYAANSTGESTIYVVFEEDTKYTVTWIVNGLPYTIGAPSTTVYADERVATLPTPPEPNAYCGDVFVGWTTENPASGNFNKAPTVYNEQATFPTATGDQTFYAVFADYDEQQ